MNGLEELGGAKGHGDSAAQVACLDLDIGGIEQAVRQVHGAADCGSRAPGDGHGVAGVVAVTVGDKDKVRRCFVRGYGRQGISGQKWVCQHPVGAVGQQKTGVA